MSKKMTVQRSPCHSQLDWESISFYLVDSHFRGNDRKKGGNDRKKGGNDRKKGGNDRTKWRE